MEAKIIFNDTKRPVSVLNKDIEIGIESDMVLPDYCKDMEKILKCSLTPRISSKRIEDKALSVNGTAFLRMVYQNSENTFSAFEAQIPFSKTVDIQTECTDPAVTIYPLCEFVNCHTVSPRRFEIRAALSLKTGVFDIKEVSVASDIDEEGIETKLTELDAVIPVVNFGEEFTVSEDYELGGDKPIGSVIKMNASIIGTEEKLIADKLITKGEITVDISFVREESETVENAVYTLPVNKVFKVPGASETDNSSVSFEIIRASAQPFVSKNSNRLNLEINLSAEGQIFRKEKINAVCDAYCLKYESNCSLNDFSYYSQDEKLQKLFSESFSLKENSDKSEIIESFAAIKKSTVRVNQNGEVSASLELSLSSVLKTEDGNFTVFEQTKTLELAVAASADYIDSFCEGGVYIVSEQTDKQNARLTLCLCVSARLTKMQKAAVISRMEIQTDMPRKTDKSIAMSLYFAKAGEDIFSICKRHNTSASKVLSENSLSKMLLDEDKMLLIPMVR